MRQHPPEVAATSNPVYPYAFGYHSDTISTIMGRGTRWVYSNPSIQFDGEPAGIENDRDNARALRQTTAVAANWRAGGSELPRNNTPPPLPPPPTVSVSQPTDVKAKVLSATAVRLRWHDNNAEDTQRAEMRTEDGDFEPVA